MTRYGRGDPAEYQLRDIKRRLTRVEKQAERYREKVVSIAVKLSEVIPEVKMLHTVIQDLIELYDPDPVEPMGRRILSPEDLEPSQDHGGWSSDPD